MIMLKTLSSSFSSIGFTHIFPLASHARQPEQQNLTLSARRVSFRTDAISIRGIDRDARKFYSRSEYHVTVLARARSRYFISRDTVNSRTRFTNYSMISRKRARQISALRVQRFLIINSHELIPCTNTMCICIIYIVCVCVCASVSQVLLSTSSDVEQIFS